MFVERPLRIGITCYPSVGGSGILAAALGDELARRGHEAHFISYEPPFRLSKTAGVFFHPVTINDYELFKYPDYTLPLSVKNGGSQLPASARHPARPLRGPARHGGDPGA